MKKKNQITSKDKKDWSLFTNNLKDIHDKDLSFSDKKFLPNKTRKIDLHGLSLAQANKSVKNFIIDSYQNEYKKILVITGKGSRSKVSHNPYVSEKMSVLKYSVPEFIKSDVELLNKINNISVASLKEGGEGAFYIFLKKKL